MRAVVQRCSYCRVLSEGEETGRIGPGLAVLLGVGKGDTDDDCRYMAEKLLHLRVFEDEEEKMNRSILDAGGSLMIISQFTLYGDCRKGRRPSFFEAEGPERADELYLRVAALCREAGVPVETGRFRTHMKVELENDGPVTILLDSRKSF